MNLLSAAFAAGDAGGGWPGRGRRAYRDGHGGLAAAAVAARWLAVAPTWWGQATIASVRPPTGFFLAAALAALAALRGAAPSGRALPGGGASTARADPPHLALHARAGAGALRAAGRRAASGARPAVLARAVLAGALPLLLYLYLPIRSAIGTPFDASHPTTPRRVLRPGQRAGLRRRHARLRPARAGAARARAADPADQLRRRSALALAAGRRRGRRCSAGRAGSLLTGGVALDQPGDRLSYRAPVIADYLIPTYLVMALWIGGAGGRAGAGAAAGSRRRRRGRRWRWRWPRSRCRAGPYAAAEPGRASTLARPGRRARSSTTRFAAAAPGRDGPDRLVPRDRALVRPARARPAPRPDRRVRRRREGDEVPWLAPGRGGARARSGLRDRARPASSASATTCSGSATSSTRCWPEPDDDACRTALTPAGCGSATRSSCSATGSRRRPAAAPTSRSTLAWRADAPARGATTASSST